MIERSLFNEYHEIWRATMARVFTDKCIELSPRRSSTPSKRRWLSW
jgi:hypothetical protein